MHTFSIQVMRSLCVLLFVLADRYAVYIMDGINYYTVHDNVLLYYIVLYICVSTIQSIPSFTVVIAVEMAKLHKVLYDGPMAGLLLSVHILCVYQFCSVKFCGMSILMVTSHITVMSGYQ